MMYSIYHSIERWTGTHRVRTEEVVRENLLYSDAIELLKHYVPNPDNIGFVNRTIYLPNGFEDYYVDHSHPNISFIDVYPSKDEEEIPL